MLRCRTKSARHSNSATWFTCSRQADRQTNQLQGRLTLSSCSSQLAAAIACLYAELAFRTPLTSRASCSAKTRFTRSETSMALRYLSLSSADAFTFKQHVHTLLNVFPLFIVIPERRAAASCYVFAVFSFFLNCDSTIFHQEYDVAGDDGFWRTVHFCRFGTTSRVAT